AIKRASSLMLPFDLHVLGMPPAFNLSQDQTLHLNFRPTRRPICSFEGPKPTSQFIAELLRLKVWTFLLLGHASKARRPHKSPAHTVKDLSRGPFSSPFAAERFVPSEPPIIDRFP